MDEDGGELIGGRYALGELLGVGGTGSVFAATDVSASRRSARSGAGPSAGGEGEVAVKLLHPHLCADEASREAFLREATHMIELQHPNIVRVHAAGLHDAGGVIMPWIALDLLHGPTLREWVDAVGRLSSQDAAAIADGLLAGLQIAHAAGIVHRDISPQNVILHGVGDRAPGASLTPDMVRIVDFGLADVTGRSTLGGDVLLSHGPEGSARTGSGEGVGVVGNAAFMSPEQAQGKPVRAVSDLYQAGAVLYFALTGRAPFPRATTEQVLQAHLSAPPPVPSALAPGARSLDRVVTRAMAKTPAHRFRDAAEFRAALAAAAPGVPVTHTAGGDDPDLTEPGAVEHGAAERGAVERDPAERTLATRVLASGSGEPLSYLSPTLEPQPAPTRVRGGGGLAAGVIGVVILALAGWAVVAAAASPSEPTAEVSASSTPTTAPEPTPTSAASTSPPAPVETEAPAEIVDAAVPALHGTLADAEAALRGVGLTLGQVTRVESAEALDRVLTQSPGAGEPVAPGSAVAVTVASGNNVVPQVQGMTYAAASALLESSGFTVGGERPASPVTVTVASTQPGAGTVLRVGVTVSLVVAAPSSPTPRPTTTETTGGTP